MFKNVVHSFKEFGAHGRFHQQLHGLFKDLKTDLKDLKHCPELLNEVINVAGPKLKEVVANVIDQVKAAKPHLEAELKTTVETIK